MFDYKKAEFDVKEEHEENECPFCNTVREILNDLLNVKSYDDKFAILHSAFSECQEVCYQEGLRDALRANAESMLGLANEIDKELNCDGNCDNCELECEDEE
jgi:hypothetical protein